MLFSSITNERKGQKTVGLNENADGCEGCEQDTGSSQVRENRNRKCLVILVLAGCVPGEPLLIELNVTKSIPLLDHEIRYRVPVHVPSANTWYLPFQVM